MWFCTKTKLKCKSLLKLKLHCKTKIKYKSILKLKLKLNVTTYVSQYKVNEKPILLYHLIWYNEKTITYVAIKASIFQWTLATTLITLIMVASWNHIVQTIEANWYNVIFAAFSFAWLLHWHLKVEVIKHLFH